MIVRALYAVRIRWWDPEVQAYRERTREVWAHGPEEATTRVRASPATRSVEVVEVIPVPGPGGEPLVDAHLFESPENPGRGLYRDRRPR